MKFSYPFTGKEDTYNVFGELLSLERPHCIYTDNDNCTDELVNTGRDFIFNSVMDLPFKSCIFIAENSYYKGGETTKAAFLISKKPPAFAASIGFYKNIKTKSLPDYFFMEIPIINNRPHAPLKYLGYAWQPKNIINADKEQFALSASFFDGQEEDRLINDKLKAGIAIVVGATMLMNTKYSIHNCIKRDTKMNARREKNGKDPYDDYTVIDLIGKIANDANGTHASPVPHWRRGHIRHLENGKMIKIDPMIVNFKGVIPPTKKYSIEPEKERMKKNVQAA